MSKSIKEVLDSLEIDSSMSGYDSGKYWIEGKEDAIAEIKRIIEEAKPEVEEHNNFSTMAVHGYYSAIVKHLDDYHNNLLKALGE